MRMIPQSTSRSDRLIRERIHDPYRNKQKPGPGACPGCGAVFRAGRWQHAEFRSLGAHEMLCQACQRIRDKYPAGLITLSGSFLTAHKGEILGLVRHLAQEEYKNHVLHRIMSIEESPSTVVIMTTDIHLPRRIAEALHRAFKGDLEAKYEEAGCFLRVNWKRDDDERKGARPSR